MPTGLDCSLRSHPEPEAPSEWCLGSWPQDKLAVLSVKSLGLGLRVLQQMSRSCGLGMEARVREPLPSSWVLLPLTTEAELLHRRPGAMRTSRKPKGRVHTRGGPPGAGAMGSITRTPGSDGGVTGGHALASPSPQWRPWMGQRLAQKPLLDLGSVSGRLGADGARGEAAQAGLGHTGRSTRSGSRRGTPRSRDPDEGAGCRPFLAQDTGTPSGAPSSCSQGRWWSQ